MGPLSCEVFVFEVCFCFKFVGKLVVACCTGSFEFEEICVSIQISL